MDEDTLTKLKETVNKEKKISHNKLQSELEYEKLKYVEISNELERTQESLYSIKKENDSIKELNENQKKDYTTLSCTYDELLNKYNELVSSSDNDKETHVNVKNHLISQIESLKNDILIKNTSYQEIINEFNEVSDKHNELKRNYQSLTQVYSKQVYENDILKKDLEHSKNECKITSDNNKILHDELSTIKNYKPVKLTQSISTIIPPIQKIVGNVTSIRGSKPSNR